MNAFPLTQTAVGDLSMVTRREFLKRSAGTAAVLSLGGLVVTAAPVLPELPSPTFGYARDRSAVCLISNPTLRHMMLRYWAKPGVVSLEQVVRMWSDLHGVLLVHRSAVDGCRVKYWPGESDSYEWVVKQFRGDLVRYGSPA